MKNVQGLALCTRPAVRAHSRRARTHASRPRGSVNVRANTCSRRASVSGPHTGAVRPVHALSLSAAERGTAARACECSQLASGRALPRGKKPNHEVIYYELTMTSQRIKTVSDNARCAALTSTQSDMSCFVMTAVGGAAERQQNNFDRCSRRCAHTRINKHTNGRNREVFVCVYARRTISLLLLPYFFGVSPFRCRRWLLRRYKDISYWAPNVRWRCSCPLIVLDGRAGSAFSVNSRTLK